MTRLIFSPYVVCLLTFVIGTVLTSDAFAQESPIREGDRIQVKFLGDWYDARVTEIVRDDLMLKATFTDGRGKERIGHLFGRSSFRAVEQPVDNEPSIRKWTSSGGKFSIKATFAGMDGEYAMLIKEDGTSISVSMTSLCKEDNEYVNSLTENIDSGSSEPSSDMDNNGLLVTITDFAIDDVPKIEIDADSPAPIFPDTIGPAEFSRRKFDFGDLPFIAQVQDFILDRTGAMAIGSVRVAPGMRGSMELFVIDMKSGKVRHKLPFPLSQAIVCDISSDGAMLLTKTVTTAREQRVDLWKLEGDSIQHNASWALPEQSKLFDVVEFASFTHDDKVLTLSRSGNLVIWDIDPLNPVAKLKTDYRYSSFARNSYQVSRNRKYMYCILNGFDDRPSTLATIDLVNHQCLGATEFENRNNSLAVDPSGKRIAVLGKGILTILDEKSNLVDEMSASFAGFGDRIEWLDDRFLLIRRAANVTVFDTVTRVPLWNYRATGLITMGEPEFQDIVVDNRGKFWVSNSQGKDKEINAFKIPHENAVAKIPKDPESVLLFKKGMTISIDLAIKGLSRQELDSIQDHFVTELENQGLEIVSVDNKPDLRLRAGSALGASESTEYEDMEGNRETVTSRSTTLTVQILDDKGLAWGRLGSSGGDAMPVIIVAQGQSAQSAAGGSFTNAQFFLETRFPMHVVRQPPGGAYGFSIIEQGEMVDLSK